MGVAGPARRGYLPLMRPTLLSPISRKSSSPIRVFMAAWAFNVLVTGVVYSDFSEMSITGIELRG
jgi:hypothetical protein